ncbi:MAG TPA: hypothetical protein VE243_10000, partial [Candidatus Acidoferrum sp.]|nr:hypothetical protein [Candidatus Acidoferrum sp.]
MSKSTRHLPLVFAGGAAEKVDGIRKLLPDTVFALWSKIGSELKQAMARRIIDPVVPRSIFETYSGTPLLKKLGFKANSSIALVDAPDGFAESLSPLPDGATLRVKSGRGCDLTMWFVRSGKVLNRRIKKIATDLDDGLIWIAWPKKTSAIASDLSQVSVRG